MTSILNLRHLHPLKVDESEHDYHVRATTDVAPAACPHCQSRQIIKHTPYEVLIRDLPVHGKRVGIYLDRQRYRCKSCGKTFTADIPEVDDRRNMTRRLVKWIGEQAVKRPFLHVAEECGVDRQTVTLIFSDYVGELEKKVRFEAPQMMGIDEIHIIRKPRCVIGNIERNTIVEMLPNRNKTTVAAYLTRLPGREKVRYVAMDMWTPYRDACQTVLPQATIVVDKFHVLRMANGAVEAVRKAHRASLTAPQRRGLMHDRFVMLKRPGDLTDREKLLLDGWTANYPLLDEAYRAKEAFYGFYECRTKSDAHRYYQAWENSLSDRVAPAFKDITSAFRNWGPLILTYFDHRITNAFSESMNNLIRLMNRLGRGYSFDALRAKVLFTDRAQVRRPKFERRVSVEDVYMDRMTSFQSTKPRREFSTGSGEPMLNYGVDIATLTRLLESGDL